MHSDAYYYSGVLILSLSICLQPTLAQETGFTPFIEGKVQSVLNGSEIVILNSSTNRQVRVRLRGTAAPESKQQAYGAQSLRHLISLIGGKTVLVEFKFTDKFGRVLGRVLHDGEDINLAQLDAGFAWFHTELTNEISDEDKHLYEEAEREARKAGRGLWKDATPVPPWVFRSSKGISDEPEVLPLAPVTSKPIIANRRAKIYYLPNCSGYARVPSKLRVPFKDREEAERAGYKLAPSCAQ